LPPLPQGPTYGVIYRDERGLYCREYQTSGVIDGRRQRLYGTVCLRPDGSWNFNN
jgi:surface antigen